MSSTPDFQCFISSDNRTVAYHPEDQQSTVYDLRMFTWDRIGIHPDNFYLLYGSKRLKDDDIVKDIVQQDHTVRVMLYSSPRSSQETPIGVSPDNSNL